MTPKMVRISGNNSYIEAKIGSIVRSESNPGEGWLPCDGRSLNINQYRSLYLTIGYFNGFESDHICDGSGYFVKVDNTIYVPNGNIITVVDENSGDIIGTLSFEQVDISFLFKANNNLYYLVYYQNVYKMYQIIGTSSNILGTVNRSDMSNVFQKFIAGVYISGTRLYFALAELIQNSITAYWTIFNYDVASNTFQFSSGQTETIKPNSSYSYPIAGIVGEWVYIIDANNRIARLNLRTGVLSSELITLNVSNTTRTYIDKDMILVTGANLNTTSTGTYDHTYRELLFGNVLGNNWRRLAIMIFGITSSTSSGLNIMRCFRFNGSYYFVVDLISENASVVVKLDRSSILNFESLELSSASSSTPPNYYIFRNAIKVDGFKITNPNYNFYYSDYSNYFINQGTAFHKIREFNIPLLGTNYFIKAV